MLLAAGVRTTDLPAVRAGLDRAVRTGLRRVTAGTVGGVGSAGGFGAVGDAGAGGVGRVGGPTGGAGRGAALDPVHRGRALHDLRRMLQVVDRADLWWVSAAAGREVVDHPVERHAPSGLRGPGRPGAGTVFPAPSGLLLWEGPTGLTLQVTGGRRRVVTGADLLPDDGLLPGDDHGWPVCGVLWFRVEGQPVVVPLSERTAPGSRHRVAAAGPEDTLAGGYRRLTADPPLADLLTGTWDALAAGRLATTVRRVVHRGAPVRRHEVHRAHHVAG